MSMFDEYPVNLTKEDLIEINTKEKLGKPGDDGRQMFKYSINFYNNGEKKAQDIYSYDEFKIGDWHIPAMRPKSLYVQEINPQTKEKYIKRKAVIILSIGKYVHS